MYNKYLKKILTDHPLLGLDNQFLEPSLTGGLTPPDWVQEGPVYEIFVRNFTSEGTFSGVINKLPYLKDLGIKTIWLMPIYPIGKIDRKGSLGSPYAIRDHRQIDQNLGTKASFVELIKIIHRYDMRIIIDLVANHAAADHVWNETSPQYFMDYQSKKTRKISDWTDVIDFDYTQQEFRQMMIETICYWLLTFDIDGFRCDVAGLVPLDFWEDVYSALSEIKKDVFLLAEWESAEFHNKSFNTTYDWSTYFVLKDIFEEKRNASDCLAWHTAKQEVYPRESLPLRFTENHDLKRTRNTFGKDSFYPFVVFNYTIYGIPLIYNGQEAGQEEETLLFDKDCLDWSRADDHILRFYKKLIGLRKDFPALSSRQLNPIQNNHSKSVVSFEKVKDEQKMLVLLNFSNQSLKLKIDLPLKYHNTRNFEDVFSGNSLRAEDLRALEIKPHGFYILKPVGNII